jgi:hypothetical protein
MAELFEHCVVEVLCIVKCYVSGYTVPAYDVLPDEFFDWYKAHIGERLRFYPFCKVLNHYYCEGVIALCWGQLSDDVGAPPLQGPWRINYTGCAGAFIFWENFWHASHVDTSFVASSIIAGH